MISVTEQKRPTLEELAAQSSDPFACPRCGCCDWRVATTWRCKDGSIRRKRYCRHCSFARTTYETTEKPKTG